MKNIWHRISSISFFSIAHCPREKPNFSARNVISIFRILNYHLSYFDNNVKLLKVQEYEFFNRNLNDEQKSAVNESIDPERRLFMIHGPPGTGKTTVLVEIVRQLIKQKKRVIFAAPSNITVDSLLAKLPEKSKGVVRLGKLARITDEVFQYHMNAFSQTSEAGKEFKKMERELMKSRVIF